MLHSLGAGIGALGAAELLQGDESAARLHFPARAKRVIHLFMNGGPFQGDFFDPKPALEKFAGERPAEVDLRTERATAGLLPSPFKFQPAGQSGVPVSELLPNLARHIDEICVLRSLYTDNPNHGPALYLMNNGTITPRRLSMGSWFLYGLGRENENLPGYVVLCPGRPVRFSVLWTSAFLPGEFQGTYINHSDLNPQKLIPYLRNADVSIDEQAKQIALLRRLNEAHLEQRGGDRALEARLKAMESAFHMQTEAFDLTREPQAIRDEYGSGHFAHGCLMARRLVERGVRFVQVYYGNGQPWDTHNDHHNAVRKLAGDIDQPIAALLGDLKRRGLLDDTLVIWGGEFGRTPTSENGSGRDHNHYGFTMWLAGGGVRGGTTYGATDEFGFRAVENRIHIHDLHATILYLLGLDHERLTYRYAGRDFRLTDVHGRVVREVLA
ncbi:MAG: DUF1501 domain-containing protein [Planctomycetes bacterium]|nr:DUF1501 domain-containing protein [Planctomycetota bacterium]